jgi:cytochrome P450
VSVLLQLAVVQIKTPGLFASVVQSRKVDQSAMMNESSRTPCRPPGPNDHLFGLRTMSRMKSDLLGSRLKLQRDYGDCVSLGMGPYRLFVFFHPDQVREVLVTHARSMIRLPRVTQTFAQWNGSSILIAEGEQWIHQRRLVQHAFQPSRMDHYGRTMVSSARRLVDLWLGVIDREGWLDVDIDEAMTRLTLSIICRTMFDSEIGDTSAEIADAVSVLSEVAFREMQSPFSLPTWIPTARNRRKRWAIDFLKNVVRGFVRERRENDDDRGDLLSILMTAEDEESGGRRLNENEVCDEAMTLMLTGHDTTAAALDWLWYNIARFPDVARRCHDEVDSVVGGRDPVSGDMDELDYLVATIKESLRLYPPVVGVFPRQTTADLIIGGYEVPRKSLVALSSFVTQRDPRWFPDPERFDPQRFLPPRIDEIPDGAWFPFGTGPRSCIGQSFAMTEIVLVAATMLQSYSVTTIAGADEPGREVKMTLRPKGRLMLRWKRRRHSDVEGV